MLDLIKKHLAAFAEGNWDGYRANLADNVVYEEIATGARGNGPDEYTNLTRPWKKAFPDLQATITSSVVAGDRVVVELEWTGTHRAPLDTPFGNVPATNKRGRVRAIEAFRIADGKVVESRHYFDLLTLMTQLGLVPGIAPPQPEQPAAARSRQ